MAVMWNRIFNRVDESWRQKAACRLAGRELFFPTGSKEVVTVQIEAAKAVCRSCPVQDECLRFALDTNQEDGIWGGKDERERRSLRRAWHEARRVRGDR